MGTSHGKGWLRLGLDNNLSAEASQQDGPLPGTAASGGECPTGDLPQHLGLKILG